MDYREQVEQKLYELKRVAKQMFKVDIGEYSIKYDLTSQRALGMIKTRKGVVSMRLNRLLLEEDAKLYIDEVLIHEYAHLIVDARFPKGYNGYRRVKPHGREFQAVCRALGVDGSATTDAFRNSEALNNAKKTKKKVTHYYKCKCVIPSELTLIQHNKVQRGKATYSCTRCGTSLSYIKSV